MRISIIVPALEESELLSSTLSAINPGRHEELIVVDGMSRDDTARIARRFTPKVFQTTPGRAAQMNEGARHATGDILFFMHSDCVAPPGAFEAIRAALAFDDVAAGAFDLSIDQPGMAFRIIESVSNIRSRLTRVPYGDQGLFMRADTFHRIGGFREMPLMEDIEIARRLKRIGRIEMLRSRMLASARRWVKGGIVHTTLLDWSLAFRYIVLRTKTEELARKYKHIR